jgi:hypothetical protein
MTYGPAALTTAPSRAYRRSATPAQIASTTPNGHVPARITQWEIDRYLQLY